MFGIPLFSILITLYLFLGGAAAGALFTMAAWSIVFHRNERQQSERLKNAFKSLLTKSYLIGLVLLVFSIFCLVWDLGSPERVLYLFFKPHLTVLTFGSYFLLILSLIGFLLAAVNLLDLSFVKGKTRKLLEYLCCFFALAVIIYVGVFLATNASVPFWNNWVLVALFLFSSLSCGVSIVLLIDYFIKDQTLLLRAARPLQRAHVLVLLLEALSLAGFLAIVFTNPAAAKSIDLLMEPGMLSTAVIGVVGMGIVIPLFLESYNLLTKPYRTIPISDVICLLGGFFLRYVIILCGVH